MRTAISALAPSQKRDTASFGSSKVTPQPALRQHPLLHLQRAIGNQAVLRLLRGQQESGWLVPRMQAKLKVNEPGDVHEREADRVADQVMRMPDSGLPRKVDAAIPQPVA